MSEIIEKYPNLLNGEINNFRWTILHVAAYYGHEDIIKILKEMGVDQFCQNSSGYTAKMLAEYNNK